MFHEHAKRNIIREHLRAPSTFGVVRNARIQFGHQKSRFALMLIANDVPRNGEPIVHDHLRICLRRLEKIPKSHVLFLFVVALLSPCRSGLAVKDNDVEESIQK